MYANLARCLTEVAEFQDWPAMSAMFARSGARPRPDWELPFAAGQAVGGDPGLIAYGAAALACLQISIILADDLLDDDPRGEHLKIGAGRAANLALGFQGAAAQVLARAPVEPARQAAAQRCLAQAALRTALGQDLDAQNLEGEAAYWRVVAHKSTPFYAATLEMGALLGGAAPEVCAGLHTVGERLGEIIQLNDDVVDAFETPANPDWCQGRNNLLILYARTASHPEQAAFGRLQAEAAQTPAALAEAQQLLIRCGAVSYAVYQLVERAAQAHSLLSALPLKAPAALARQLNPLSPALRTWLTDHGLPTSGLLVESRGDNRA